MQKIVYILERSWKIPNLDSNSQSSPHMLFKNQAEVFDFLISAQITYLENTVCRI